MDIQSKYHRAIPVRRFDLNQTLYQTVFEQNKNNMDVDAIGFLGKNITFRELKKNVDRLADAYIKLGVKEGDTVGICTINMPIVQENLLALSKIGVTSKWIDLRIKGKDLVKNINENKCHMLVVFDGIIDGIMEIIDETEVSTVLVASPKDYLNPVIKAIANLKDKKEGKNVTIPKDKRIILYKHFLKTGDANSLLKPVSLQKDKPAIIVQSSGSTGMAKSIKHTEYNFNSCMQKEAYSDLPFMVGKSMYVTVPPFIIYGLNNSIYAALAFGMKAEMTPYWSENTIFDDLGKYDFACAAPFHYRYLYKKINKMLEEMELLNAKVANRNIIKMQNKKLKDVRKKLARVKVFMCGGDKISSQELLMMEHLIGAHILNGYGNNELTGAAIISPVYANRPDSVGIPMKGITVAAFEPDTFNMLNTGEEGEICIHSDSVFVGYLNNEEETKRIKQTHDDGLAWIHTGDLGYVDHDGYVYITGRAKRLIKREAFKIAPETIENVILEMESVRDCVVVGVTDLEHEGSFVPMAYIEIDSDDEAKKNSIKTEIMERCKSELPDYEIPKYIELIDKIPYKNTKHDFKQLEAMGEEYVKQYRG